MPYCHRSEIEDQIIPSAKLISLCDDEEKGKDNPNINLRITAIIASVDRDIDDMLNGLYDVPFSPVPSAINSISIAFAAFNIWGRRSGDCPENIKTLYKGAQTKLDLIREGKVQLYPKDKTVGGGNPIVNKREEDRVFGKNLLDMMP
jgi:phage gp36-like protein